MQTCSGPSIDTDLVECLKKLFLFVAPRTSNINYLDVPLDGLESVSMKELEDAFKIVKKETKAAETDVGMDVDGKEHQEDRKRLSGLGIDILD